jgi:hypothetical protein
MKAFRFSVSIAALFAGLLSVQVTTHAEEFRIGNLDQKTIEGPYSYVGDGVPVLGWIVARLPDEMVEFLLCNGSTKQVSQKLLKTSSGKCLQERRQIGPWVKDRNGNKIVTVGFPPPADKNGPREINVNALSPAHQMLISKAKSDDWVALTFSGPDGTKFLGIVEPPGPQ